MEHVPMFLIMVLSGLLSTMNVYVDKFEDIRFSLNDIYMVLLMGGWMLFFTGIYYNELHIALVGLGLILVNIYCIRTQFFISKNQYIDGMIPHHSMAVLMSKKLLQKDSSLQEFLQNLIQTQINEIKYMKMNR
jgi:hypothetical protein